VDENGRNTPFSLHHAVPITECEHNDRSTINIWGTTGVVGDSIIVKHNKSIEIHCNTNKTPPVRWGLRVSSLYNVDVSVYYIDEYHGKYGSFIREFPNGGTYSMHQSINDAYGVSLEDFNYFKQKWFGHFVP
jgi:hypothetical protein